MDHYCTKTPEQRKAIAQKGRDTRARNKLTKEIAMKAQALRLDVVENQIIELEGKRDELILGSVLSGHSAHLTGKTLLRESEIVEGCQPWGNSTGVYFLIKKQKVVYVGQSVSVYSRISNHEAAKEFDSIAWVACENKVLDWLESLYIHSLRPVLNGNMSNGYKNAPLSLDSLLKRVI